MTEDETENTVSAGDLLDRLRQAQPRENEYGAAQKTEVITSDVSINNDLPLIDDEIQQEETDPEVANSEDANQEETAPENGRLQPEARRALVSLLKHGVILAGRKGRLFETICRYQSEVRSHLADIYLKLMLDERAGVVFVAQIDEDDSDEEITSLITRRTLSLYDTLLLLVLRKHYQDRESAGEQRIIIDLERIESNLSPFLPLTNSAKLDRKKLIVALNKMIEKRLLSKVRGSNDRLEITPVIRYVVNAQFLEKMLKEYQQLASEAAQGANINQTRATAKPDEHE
jgi:hypothetical protein